ncbi:MAG: SMI1/KNR4 family protein [Phycisphaerales bacterium]|nr:SMI1/KNR4 family protein [Phycisphaerales bacterium]
MASVARGQRGRTAPKPRSRSVPAAEELFDPPNITDPRPAIDATIAWTEKKLGVRLPASYKKLVKLRNGGSLRLSTLRLRKPIDGSRELWVTEIAGVHRKHDRSLTALAEITARWEIDPLLVPLADVGYAYLAFDYRRGRTASPRIVHVDAYEHTVTPIADSFEDFLRMLEPGEHASEPAKEASEPQDLNGAIARGNIAAIRRILDSGVDPASARPDPGASSALDLAASAGNTAIFRLCLLHTNRLPTRNATSIAIRRGHLGTVKLLLERRWKPNETDLDSAVWSRSPSMVRLILDQGVQPKKSTVRHAAGLIPPSMVVTGHHGKKHPKILKMLIDAGGETPRELRTASPSNAKPNAGKPTKKARVVR